MNTLKTWVKSRWFTHALGLLLIAALIWLGVKMPLGDPKVTLPLLLMNSDV